MKRRNSIKKILGILIALGGAVVLIECVPLWIWYTTLGVLCIILILLFLIR
ncbi:hypothetical protein [Inediibacterium massiliense]|uniref:hypothetical protein n=1 Tax=Inediibacterium massiliense TaxID=1658111 RepID=UPI0018FEED53|nr:hypothetical protein [Inediibacterium massiliense]